MKYTFSLCYVYKVSASVQGRHRVLVYAEGVAEAITIGNTVARNFLGKYGTPTLHTIESEVDPPRFPFYAEVKEGYAELCQPVKE